MEQLRLFDPAPDRRRSERGAELVEFALIFPVLLMFIVAALSLLWMGFMKVAAAQSAKEAARYASVPVACEGSLGTPLAVLPEEPAVPAVPAIPAVPELPQKIPVVPKVPAVPAIPQAPAAPQPPAIPEAPQAQGEEVSPPMQLVSYQAQLPPILPTTTTLPSSEPTTTTTLLPELTIPTLLPTTTTTAAPSTTTTTEAPTTTTTAPTTTTTTVPPQCSPNFRTYPQVDTVRERVERRVPAGLWGFQNSDFDIVYTYTDPDCADPDDKHSPPGNSTPRCATPAPNDPPSNAKVDVKLTKELKGPLGVFAGIFGVHDISANSGGETRAE
jgi:hypothetical protein